MKTTNNILFEPRKFDSIELFKNVTAKQWFSPVWQLNNSITTVNQLSKVIELNEHQKKEIDRTVSTLKSQGKESLRITPYYASLMHSNPFEPVFLIDDKPGKRIDPIFWQSVPTPANLLFPDTGIEAAMSEGTRSFGAAYQRYPNRVALFVAENTSCASYCVHCQRSKSLDCTVEVTNKEIDKGLFYISYNTNIDEVLVTGGDALMISKKKLQYVLEELSRIPHLRAIRIATRVPVVLPMAISNRLLQFIKTASNKYNTSGLDKYVYFMTHINHHQEITLELTNAVKKIRNFGFTVRNQTVLLNHINDSYKVLAETFRRMFWIGVHPYYLLQCHKEKGIVHFISPIQIGQILIKHLQGWLSGVSIPKYASNLEGGGGKVLLMPSGHDTLNIGNDIEEKISESFATINTWDGKVLHKYEALGRATREEYQSALEVMNNFIGRVGVFLPKVIIIDNDGNHIETTNRTKLPTIENLKKAKHLSYNIYKDIMPLTNPSEIENTLNEEFVKSNFQNNPLSI